MLRSVGLKLVQRSWFYFRVGNGTYMGFPLGFAGNMAAIYELVLAKVPFFAQFHFIGFLLTGGTSYILAAIVVGRLHMRTQAFVDAEVSAPQNPYVYKMFPYGTQAFQGMQMGRMQTEYTIKFNEIQKDLWKALHEIAPETVTAEKLAYVVALFDGYSAEMKKYLEMYNVLLAGGELGRGKIYDFKRSEQYQSPYKDE